MCSMPRSPPGCYRRSSLQNSSSRSRRCRNSRCAIRRCSDSGRCASSVPSTKPPLAERRYEEVDPAQRLVAATLERRWNDALLSLEELKKQYTEFEQKKARVATPEQKAQVLALAE